MWRDIPGYEGIYQASKDGQIRRIDGKYGRQTRKTPCYIIKPTKATNGYLRYTLCDKDGNRGRYQGHRLVALAFGLTPKYVGQVINHKDGNKQNNSIKNLEWCSQKENVRHARHVLGKKPETALEKPIICLDTGVTYRSIHNASKRLNLYATNICKVLKGKIKSTGGFKFAYADKLSRKEAR